MSMSSPLKIGFLCFPKVTQLDLTGPVQVFSAVSDVHLVWKNVEPVSTDTVITLKPTISFADAPQFDVVCVPGGQGTDQLVEDAEVLDFLRKQAAGARFMTSVCTGSLVLGAAGLLKGYRATSHWRAAHLLSLFGATPSRERVCIDRDRVTGGGVTAGIDFALTLVSMLIDRPTAEAIQLRLEYNPAPPFNAGSPETAPSDVLELAKQRFALSDGIRLGCAQRAAARLNEIAAPASVA